ncbi:MULTISPECIES: Tat pathway signal sequence domain protein [Streptomyces]|uniref:Tat pathway signal sequence domain protein n=2 Tax=Streptomyces TaxID=1883 RepID=A0A2U9P969_STRAS|nr:Tat pathway signal sequence domain protein [Streptomyces actuosus]AWT46102.1 Tat pathway signal sequence domain protein [Streptomyces actuosus]MBM4822765.1 Tat pathway signal sequence domain protein [Streptomyces actuosus]
MRTIVHRHLGKVVAGAAVAVVGTAAMVAITLPGTAGADETGGSARAEQRAAGGGAQGAASGPGGPGAAVAPGVVEQAPAEGKKGTGRDPLTDDEIARVESLAVDRRMAAAAEDVEGDRGPQRLGVDLAEPAADELDDPHAPRRAVVTFYDYRADTLVTRTVDLDSGKIEATTTQHGVQPPLSAAENAEAARLLIADPLGAGLRADFKDATGKDLTSPDQLLLNSAVYRAAPGAQPAVLDACGTHRCLRLFPKVVNGPWIDTRHLVIDLSARKVAALDRG